MGYYFESTGLEFETEFTEKISEFSMATWGKGAFKISSLAEDTYRGTDCYVLGVPVDVTLAYEKKRRMKHVDCQLSFDGIEVNFGIRYGNGRIQFEKPVLVIGVASAAGLTKYSMWNALRSLNDHMQEILETGMDAYFEAVPE